MSRRPRLLCLCEGGPAKASSWYRVHALLPHLQAQLDCRARAWPSRWLSRLPAWPEVARCDGLLLQRRIPSLLEWRALRALAPRVVFDLDDAIHLGLSGSRRHTFELILRQADAVICSTECIAADLRSLRPDLLVQPTCVDPAEYPLSPAPREPGAGQPLIVGWSGSSSGYAFFSTINRALRELQSNHPGWVLRLLCNRPPRSGELEGLRWEFQPFARHSLAADLSGLHLGLMPLTDDAWSRAKCGFKLMQYHMLGVPGLAADVGFNRELIRPGAGGWLYRDEEEFHSRLEAILCDPAQLAAMRPGLREGIVSRFPIQQHVQRLLDVLQLESPASR
jgi:glycosyltransferase involved in cell wall biosynthesis